MKDYPHMSDFDRKEVARCRRLATKHPGRESELYLCIQPQWVNPVSHHPVTHVWILTPLQDGYKTAIERVPYVYKRIRR